MFHGRPLSAFAGRNKARGLLAHLKTLAMLGLLLQMSFGATAAQESPRQNLIGIFTVAVGKADIPNGLPGADALLGLWTVAFNADGTLIVERKDVGRVAEATYSLAGSTLTIDHWRGVVGCAGPAGRETAADYAWRREEIGLVLTPITEPCGDRRVLLGTRPFASFEACATRPFGAESIETGSLATGAATDTLTTVQADGVAAQEGRASASDPQEAIDALLRQATGCWATGEPTRFLPLHSEEVISELSILGPLPDFAATLQSIMTVPLSFKRIGTVSTVDATHAWAYVEVTFGGEALPQRMDFILENGTWLIDVFFLLGPDPGAFLEP